MAQTTTMRDQSHLSELRASTWNQLTNVPVFRVYQIIYRPHPSDSIVNRNGTQHYVYSTTPIYTRESNVNDLPHEWLSTTRSFVPFTFLEGDEVLTCSWINQEDEDISNELQILPRLDEEIGPTGTALSGETISKHLKIRTYSFPENMTDSNKHCNTEEPEMCVICQGEYENNDKIGTLQCGHEYHEGCIKKWLFRKNVCPLCNGPALSTEKKT